MLHQAGESDHDLAAMRVVCAHATEPQAVLLRAVEHGEFLFRNESVALAPREAHGVAVSLEVQEQFGSIVVFPRACVDSTAPKPDDKRKMLDADRTLILTR